MKSNNAARAVMVIILSIITLCIFPLSSLASDKDPVVSLPKALTVATPPASEISGDADNSSGTCRISAYNVMLAGDSPLAGGCGITKNSSTSVTVSGYSSSTTSSYVIKVTLLLQAYYDGSWHTLATKVNSTTGSYVSASQTYNVTAGYYYRTYAYHSLSDGTSRSSSTKSIYVG